MENNNATQEFKLIAFRPLKGCNPGFLKVLQEDEVYKFYSDYHFEFSSQGDVNNIEYLPTIPEDLFHLNKEKANFKLNISAIVGENGSGKSTLIELLFAAVYNLSLDKKILTKYEGEKLKFIEDIKLQIFYSLGDSIFSLNVDTEKYVGDQIKFEIELKYINVYDKTKNRNFKIAHIENNFKELFYNYFFYTIAVNYSIYSLNSGYLGNWINPLFHKNDGYTTPIVINPMREEGVFNINREDYLVRQRLMSNILEPIDKSLQTSLRNITKDKEVTGIRLNYNAEKFENQLELITRNTKKYGNNGDELFDPLYKAYFELDNIYIEDTPEIQLVQFYVINKIIKICEKYPNYKKYIKKGKFVDIDFLTSDLIKDSSHVTFKLKQALNFIFYGFYVDYLNNQGKIFNTEKLSSFLKNLILFKESVGSAVALIELLPPPFFEIELILNNDLSFNDLSSGEKQKIYSISSIAYHIINLNSVKNTGHSDDLFKYKYVNVIFDEVELYFHPDFQRNFVHDVIDYLEKINSSNVEHISGINICFATHSPFILSDIPNANILYLQKDEITKKSKQFSNRHAHTFGANIHELFTDTFFLKDGLMGEFARKKIVSLIEDINNLPDKFISKEVFEQKFQNRISIIGEPFLRSKLYEMIANKSPSDVIDEIINQRNMEIDMLQQIKSRR
jgi:ABC-type oligopeptide transport system ATPase subunit